MKCRSCGTEIAEKAIVCFRCGTPTDIPAAPARAAAPRRRTLPVDVLILVLVIAGGVWLLPPLMTEGAAGLYVVWAGVVAAMAMVLWWRRRRKPPGHRVN